jgi:hypothetical protein
VFLKWGEAMEEVDRKLWDLGSEEEDVHGNHFILIRL